MKLTANQKLLALSVGAFAILTASNIAAQAIYARNQLNADKKILLLTGFIGIGLGYLMMKKK